MSAFTERELRRLAGPARLTRARSLLGSVSDLYEDELSVCAAVEDSKASGDDPPRVRSAER